jgi:hypothetical protein
MEALRDLEVPPEEDKRLQQQLVPVNKIYLL